VTCFALAGVLEGDFLFQGEATRARRLPSQDAAWVLSAKDIAVRRWPFGVRGIVPLALTALPEDFEGAPRRAVADLQPGETVQGVVLRNLGPKRYEVDVGAMKVGDLKVGELRDGFPTDDALLKRGDRITARVLKLDPMSSKFWLTMRSGNLLRPPWEHDKLRGADVTSFVGIPEDQWFDGQVVDMSIFAVWVRLVPPDGGRACEGMVHKTAFSDGFVDSAAYGQHVKVRVLSVDGERGRLTLSMREP